MNILKFYEKKNKKIKIIRIISRLNIGGPAKHVVSLNVGLDPLRFEQILISGVDNRGEGIMSDLVLDNNLKVIYIPELVAEFSLKLCDLIAFIKIFKIICKERPDIVHTHTAKAGVLGRLAARLAGVSLIFHTYHGHVFHGYFSFLKSWSLCYLDRMVAFFTDRIIVVSNAVKEDLVKYGIVSSNKIAIIALGFNLVPLLECKNKKGELRKELGIGKDSLVVGIVGRIAPIKNHSLFLEAAARVISKNIDVYFIVVGDGLLRKQEEERARTLGISERVIFMGWRRDLTCIYADMDILVVSSINEGTPVAAIEAMAVGCSVVATRVGGVVDLIQDGQTGLLVESQDSKGLAEAILKLFLDPQLRDRISTAAKSRAIERFSLSRLLKDTEALYLEKLKVKGII